MRRGHLPHRLVLAVVVLLGVCPTATSFAGEAPAAAPDPASLVSQARQSGQRVEDTARRTETNTVWVNPDGTRTLEANVAPVRVRTAAGWAPVDYALVQNGDGSFSSKASPVKAKLSGGGSQPLITLDEGGVHAEFAWSSRLPKPTITGSQATYASVFPGVDLLVTSGPWGVRQLLVVKDAKAAGNPALRQVSLSTKVTGGSLLAGEGGSLSVVDAIGRPIFESAGSSMWDSAGKATSPTGLTQLGTGLTALETGGEETREDGPQEGDHVTNVPTSVSSSTLTLKPPSDALTGPGVTYPVYIDPQWTTHQRISWAMVSSAWPTSQFYGWDDADGQGVGYQNFSSPYAKKRLFFRYDTTEFAGSTILSASFSAKAVWSANCTASGVEVWRVRNIGTSGATWNSRVDESTWYSLEDTINVAAGRDECYPGGRDYSWDILGAAQTVASAAASSISLGMRNVSETDSYKWKRFLYTAKLVVEYNDAPTVATYPKIRSGTDRFCTAEAGTPSNPMLLGAMSAASQQPELRVIVSDPNKDQLKAQFEYWPLSDPSAKTTAWSATGNSGWELKNTELLRLPARADGRIVAGTWVWHARAQDTADAFGPWSAECTFKVDPDAPGAPLLTNAASGSADAAVTVDRDTNVSFTVVPNPNDTDISGFAYQWDNPAVPSAATSTGTSLSITKQAALGVHTLDVYAFDTAGNRSDKTTVKVEAVDPMLAKAATYWFENQTTGARTGAAVPDDPNRVEPALTGPVGLFAQRGVRCASPSPISDWLLLFNGGTAEAGGPVLNENGSFTISAWLDPAPQGSALTAWSVEGATGTVAKLELDVEGHYVLSIKDSAGGWQSVTVTSVTDDTIYGLRHVVASYNAMTGEVHLWVSPREGGSDMASVPASLTGIARASGGTLHLGRDAQGAAWRGAIEAVKVLNTPTNTDALVQNLREATSWRYARWQWSVFGDDVIGCL